MSQSQSGLRLSAGLAAVLLITIIVQRGCLSGPSRPPTVPVSGTVRYRGAPVADADVAFITPGNSRYAIGVTDGAGAFVLGTFVPGDGAVVGKHRVTVATSRGLPPPPPVSLPRTQEEIDAVMKWTKQYEAAVKAGRTGVPRRYAREETTPLEFTVGPNGGTFELELREE